MLTTAVGAGAVLLISLTLNLHYALCGGSALEGLFVSRLVSIANKLWRRSTRKKLAEKGIPIPTSTIEYAPGLAMDIYDPRDDKSSAAPAIIYFHAGAFVVGFRELAAGTMSWLAENGMVGISVGYRLTSDHEGLGVAGCVDSAWAAYRHVRASAASLGVDPKQLVVMGDSAGGLLALALATGLRGGENGASLPKEAPELPAACCAGWACCTLDSRSYCAARAADGSWRETPAEADMECKCIFVPASMGKTAAEAQRQLQRVLAGTLLCFGRRWRGWLPASVPSQWPDDHGASLSPLCHVHANMSPTLMLVGAADTTVPAGQQLMLAERARAAGARVGALVFEGANHGHGGVNSRAGRAALLRFLRAHRIGVPPAAAGARGLFGIGRGSAADADGARGEQFVEAAVRVFGVAQQPGWAEYDVEALDAAGGGWLQGKATVMVSKTGLLGTTTAPL